MFDYINDAYDIAAKKGGFAITSQGLGVIVGVHSATLKIKVDGDIGCYHPTHDIAYMDKHQNITHDFREKKPA